MKDISDKGLGWVCANFFFFKKWVADYFPFQLHQIRMIFCKSVFSGFRPHQLSVWDESDLNAEALVEWDTGPVCRCILFRTVTLVLSAVDKTNKRSVSKRLSLIFCNGCWLFVRTAAYKLTAQILTLEKEAFTRWEKMLHEYFLWQHICMNRANLKLYPISH